MLEPIDKPSVAESVFRDLRERILTGRYAPGEALPGERALSKSFGVNRGAVRESLKRLSQSGLVEIQHGEHTRVADFRHTGTLDLIGDVIVRPDGRLDLEAVRSMLSLGMAMRIAALRRATRRGDEVGPLLHAEVEKLRAAGSDPEAAMSARISFWQTLFCGSGELAHRMLWNSLHKVARPILELCQQLSPESNDELLVLGTMARLVAEGDPDAAERGVRAFDEEYLQPILDQLSERIEKGETVLALESATKR